MVDHYMRNAKWYDPLANALNITAGIGAGVEQSAAGLDKLARRAVGAKNQEDWLTREADKPTEGVAQTVGKGIEGAGEFLTGEEALSLLGRAGMVMKGAERLKQATQIATIANKVPMVGKLLRIGMETVKAGAMGGAQEFVKSGGDTEKAGEAGAVNAALTAGLGAGGAALAGTAKYLAKLQPGERTLEGVVIPYLQSQINKAGRFVEGGDIGELAPKIAQAQQDAAQQVIRNTSSRAVSKVLDMLNDSRTFFSRLSPATAESVPQSTSPFRFELSPKAEMGPLTEQGVAASEAQSAADQKILDTLGDKRASGQKLTPGEEQQWQMAWDREAGQMRTTPSLAQATRAHQDLNDLFMSDEFDQLSPRDQADINDIRKRLSDQIGMHHSSSRFDPINTDDLVANTHTFGHAAAQLESTVQPVIQAMDRASKGTIAAAQRGVEEASAAIRSARSSEDFKLATEAFNARQKDLSQLLNKYSSTVSGADYDGVMKVLPYVQKFQTLHNTFEHMMNGVTFEEATESGLSRVMTGSARRFQTWLDNPENTRMLDETIGKDSRTNLKELTLLMSKVQPQRHMAEALTNIGALLDKIPSVRGHMTGAGVAGLVLHAAGVPGAVIGGLGAASVAARFVLRQAATNPSIGKTLTYAIKSGVGAETYAPIISRMIAEGFRDDTKPQADQQQPEAAGATE